MHFNSVLDQFCDKISRKYLLIYDWVAETKLYFSCLMVSRMEHRKNVNGFQIEALQKRQCFQIRTEWFIELTAAGIRVILSSIALNNISWYCLVKLYINKIASTATLCSDSLVLPFGNIDIFGVPQTENIDVFMVLQSRNH